MQVDFGEIGCKKLRGIKFYLSGFWMGAITLEIGNM